MTEITIAQAVADCFCAYSSVPMGRMSLARLAPLALLACSACTVFVVPEDTDGGTGGGSSGGSTATPQTTGEPTTGPDVSSTTSPDSTTSGDPSGDPSSPTDPSGNPATSTPETTGEPPPADCDFPTSIQPIFNNCGCHNGDMPPKGLVLSAGNSFDNLVGIDSAEQPGTPRVDPGNAAGSWLVTKLKPMPPAGEQMPPGGMVPADKLALIEAWIEAGAPEAGAFSCDGGGGGGAGSVTIDPAGPVEVDIGETLDLDVTVLDGNGDPVPNPTVTWTSSDEKSLYVDGKGLLLGILPGSVQVTAEVDGVVSDPLTVNVTLNDPPPATFAEVLGVLTTRCGCHSGAMPPAMLAFDTGADAVHAALLVDSVQAPGVKRVAGDNPVQSYLFQKLTLSTPAKGTQMPQGKGPLEADKVQVILRWILAGAPK